MGASRAGSSRRIVPQPRRLTALVLAGAFLVMAVSGAVLFFGPHGAGTRGHEWVWLGLTRIEWRAVHGAMAGLFLVAAAVHAWFNWKPLLNYFKQRTGSHLLLAPEVYLALALVAAVAVAAWMGWIPLGMDTGGAGGGGHGGGGGGGGLGLGYGRWRDGAP